MLELLSELFFPSQCLYCKAAANPGMFFCTSCQNLCSLVEKEESEPIFFCFDSFSPLQDLALFYDETESFKALNLLASFVVIKLAEEDLFCFDLLVCQSQDRLAKNICRLLVKNYSVAKTWSYRKESKLPPNTLFLSRKRAKILEEDNYKRVVLFREGN